MFFSVEFFIFSASSSSDFKLLPSSLLFISSTSLFPKIALVLFTITFTDIVLSLFDIITAALPTFLAVITPLSSTEIISSSVLLY